MGKLVKRYNVIVLSTLFFLLLSVNSVTNTMGKQVTDIHSVKLHIQVTETKWISGQFLIDGNLTGSWDLIVTCTFNLSIVNLDSTDHTINQINASVHSVPSLNDSTSVFDRWDMRTNSSGLPITLKPNRYCFYSFSLSYSTRDFFKNVHINIDGFWIDLAVLDSSGNELLEDWTDITYFLNTTTDVVFFSTPLFMLIQLVIITGYKRLRTKYERKLSLS